MANIRGTMTAKEVSDFLGVSLPTAYQIMRRADFPAIPLGRKKIIPREAFYKWLNDTALKGQAQNG